MIWAIYPDILWPAGSLFLPFHWEITSLFPSHFANGAFLSFNGGLVPLRHAPRCCQFAHDFPCRETLLSKPVSLSPSLSLSSPSSLSIFSHFPRDRNVIIRMLLDLKIWHVGNAPCFCVIRWTCWIHIAPTSWCLEGKLKWILFRQVRVLMMHWRYGFARCPIKIVSISAGLFWEWPRHLYMSQPKDGCPRMHVP